MSDNELEKYLKTIEPNFDSHIEKGTIEMSNEYYNLLEERMIRLLNENKHLKEKIDILLEDNNQLEEIRIKAIEYIKENCIDDEFYINLSKKEKCIIKVLDILRGEE